MSNIKQAVIELEYATITQDPDGKRKRIQNARKLLDLELGDDEVAAGYEGMMVRSFDGPLLRTAEAKKKIESLLKEYNGDRIVVPARPTGHGRRTFFQWLFRKTPAAPTPLSDFEKKMIQNIAGALSVPYERLAADCKDVEYEAIFPVRPRPQAIQRRTFFQWLFQKLGA